MDTAILHRDGHEEVISADEYNSRFGTRAPRGSWLTCPECGQPVLARAMGHGGYVGPYFKHEDNNEVAQACELYNPGGGSTGYSTYFVPYDAADMYICEGEEGCYSLVVEFPLIGDDWAMDLLRRQGASLWAGTCEYAIDEEGFGGEGSVLLEYGVDGGSFGDGLRLTAEWPYETSFPNIGPAPNGCMIFEPCSSGRLGDRLGNGMVAITPRTEYLLVHSMETGFAVTRDIRQLSSEFDDIGSIEGSGGSLCISRFVLSDDSFLDPERLFMVVRAAL